MLKNYTKYEGDRKDSVHMDMPEPMRYVKAGMAVKQSDIEQELLDRGDYEGFRKARGLSISKVKKRKYIGEISVMKHKMKVARQKLIPEMLDKGLSYADIAWKLGVEVQTIYSDLRELGVEIEKGRDKKCVSKWLPKNDQTLILDRKNGTRIKDLARIFGVEEYVVRDRLEKIQKEGILK